MVQLYSFEIQRKSRIDFWSQQHFNRRNVVFFSDKKKFSLINGQNFGPKSVEFDYVEDPGTIGRVVDGVPARDEDPAYYGKERVSPISSHI